MDNDLLKNNEEIDNLNDDKINNSMISDNITPNNIFKELQNIFNFCLKECQDKRNHGVDLNSYYNENISKKILDFCKLLPCWSADMIPIFEYGNVTESSSALEFVFNEL